MGPIRCLGISLIAVFLLGVFAAESANAFNPPEFGICKPLSGGYFKNGNCTKIHTNTANELYEWYPPPLGGSSVHGTSPVTIQLSPPPSFTGDKVKCAGTYGEDQITGAKTLKMVLSFTGCTLPGQPCKTTGYNPGYIITDAWVNGTLEFYPTSLSTKVALRLTSSGPDFLVPFSCGLVGPFEAQGKVMGRVVGPLDTMSTMSKLNFTEALAVQNPNLGENGPAQLEQVGLIPGHAAGELAGLKFKVEDTVSPAMEINKKY